MTSILQYLFFWNLKSPQDNHWRPQPGQNPLTYLDNLPQFLKRTDLEATIVDTAPFIAGAGSLAHLSQLQNFGFTSHWSIFSNPKTLMTMHRTTLLVAPMIFVCQALGWEYRYAIPRWCHERELRREEEEVRQHVDVGMGLGAAVWFSRLAFKFGPRYWAPIDIVMGGALADLMHREYMKAHGL